jgi:hypothetical protein
MKRLREWWLSWVTATWIWFGGKFLGFTHVDLYAPKGEELVGLTLSTDPEYIAAVGAIEMDTGVHEVWCPERCCSGSGCDVCGALSGEPCRPLLSEI